MKSKKCKFWKPEQQAGATTEVAAAPRESSYADIGSYCDVDEIFTYFNS